MTGSRCGSRALELGIGTFVDDEGGYTSIAVAVSLLVSISLVLSLASVAWVQNRSADVQPVADAAALSGANVVSSYVTVATVLDSCVLTMGIAGMVAMGAGLIASAVPGLSAAGAATIDAGSKILDARQRFATSAAKGLQAVEETLPLAIVARSAAVVSANGSDELSYYGCAIPFPQTSETDFSGLDAEVSGEEMVESAQELQELSDCVKQAEDRVDAAKLAGWLADCGDEPRNMRERAGRLAGLSGAENPDYPSVEGWSFGAALLRARAYYALRVSTESPEGSGIDAITDSLCRAAFYDYALAEVRSGYYLENADGTVDLSFPELPKNTGEMRGTRLYTSVYWPCTSEDGGLVMHSSLACPGAVGPSAGSISLASFEGGAAALCEVCRMSAADLGKVAAASTSIDNGFEHFWQRVVEASREYKDATDELAEAKRALQEASEKGADAFDKALEALEVPRPKLKPAGALGCVAVVGRGAGVASPEQLAGVFVDTAELPAGAAVSAATLAPDDAADGNDSLSRLFEAVEADLGDGTAGVLGGIGRLWGSLLVGYSSAAEGISSAADDALEKIEGLPFGSAASWLRDKVSSVIKAAGFEPADLRLRKPVLTNTQNVLSASGLSKVGTARELVGRLPNTTDPVALARALGQEVANMVGSGSFTVAELPIPGTDMTIPLTIDVGELLGSVGS